MEAMDSNEQSFTRVSLCLLRHKILEEVCLTGPDFLVYDEEGCSSLADPQSGTQRGVCVDTVPEASALLRPHEAHLGSCRRKPFRCLVCKRSRSRSSLPNLYARIQRNGQHHFTSDADLTRF